MLCDASPFFKAACKPEWMTPDERTIKLPEDDPVAVQAMIYWMYHNEICIPEGLVSESDTDHLENDGMRTAWGLFVRLFILGQKYQIAGLRNDAIDGILELRKGFCLPLGIVPYAYRNTTPGSSLRYLILSIARYELESENFEKWETPLCVEFIFDFARACLRDKNYLDREEENRADLQECFCAAFHKHPLGNTQSPCVKLKQFIRNRKSNSSD